MRTHQYRDDIIRACHRCHLSAEDIYEAVRRTHPNIGQATVYRNIEAMYDLGILRKIPGVNGKAYFESNDETHAHLVDDKNRIFCDFPIENVSIANLPDGYEVSEICVFIKKTNHYYV